MESINNLDNFNSVAHEELSASGSTLLNFFNESILDVSEENSRCRTSPIHWATMSDPAGLPVLKVIVCNGTETTNHVNFHGQTTSTKLMTPVRSKSVSNLNDEKLKHSDEEVLQMRNKLLILTRNRALFQQLERNQKWTLALICVVYFFCFCAISILAPFFHHIAILHSISTSTYGMLTSLKVWTMLTSCTVLVFRSYFQYSSSSSVLYFSFHWSHHTIHWSKIYVYIRGFSLWNL